MTNEDFDHEKYIDEFTHDLIVKVINKSKNKRKIILDMENEYHVDEITELSISQKLDFLKHIDTENYYTANNEYKRIKKTTKKNKVIEYLQDLFDHNPEKYQIICKVKDCYVIANKKELSVNFVNDNSVFQPYEKSIKKDYITLLILELDHYEPNEIITNLKLMGCESHMIVNIEGIKHVFDIFK